MSSLGRASAIIVVADTAGAREIPPYDPAAPCKRVAEIDGKDSEVVYGACPDEERIAFDTFEPCWGAAGASRGA